MPADASIYGQVRPFTMESPLATTAQALQVAGGQQQLEANRRKFTLEDDISGALEEAGGDMTKASALLAQRGRGTAAISLQDKAQSQRKAQVDEKLKLWEAVGSDAITLDQTWRQLLQKNGGNAQAAMAEMQPVYGQVRQRWQQLGHQLPEQFDPNSNFAGIGMAKENIQYLKTLAPNVDFVDGQAVNKNPLAGPVGPLPGVAPLAKRAEPTELKRLQDERDALPEGDPRRARYDEVIKGYKAGKGDTNVTVSTGPMTPGKQAGNKIDEDMLGVTRNLMQLDTISGQFKPEFQRFQDKAGFLALKAKDSTVGLTNKEKQDLTEYTTYRRNAFNTLNEYIKSITGAAMSEAEANRIRKSMPDPGDGLFGGDSPTEFKAKLDDAIAQTKKSVARLAYLKRQGMSLEDGLGKGVTLEKMPQLMNERGQQIEAALKQEKPDVSKDALGKAVRRQLAIEFGLSSD